MDIDVKRAWTDPEYRKTLTREQLASLPPKPKDLMTEEELEQVAGGVSSATVESWYKWHEDSK
jgi:mersacidin/lichenicidin family type 2 lantibiotic